jgi:alkanesulfonate monooxygenase SsuD/methylene tetrahydromethanopterin reductase-like flavin-dependent oxidoreductase (luciferase family)
VATESCPHYLAFDKDTDRGVQGKVNPPLRGRDHIEALWQRLTDGTVDVMGSDHCPYTKAVKGDELWAARAGISAGSAMILPVLLTEGVNRGRLTMSDVVRLTSYRAARLFGLHPRKGALEAGSDADLVVVDLEREVKVDLPALNSAVDFSPYEGYVARGWAATTIAGRAGRLRGGRGRRRPHAGKISRGGIARVVRARLVMLRFGVMLRPGHFPFSHMLTCMRVAEDAGFEFMWFGDSHLIWQEVSPYLTAAASATRLTVGPLVSNPVTRHPTVMASMMATIAQLYDGRAVLGVGRGDSAVRTLGLPPMPVAHVPRVGPHDSQPLPRRQGGLPGDDGALPWLTHTVPVWVAGYGPRVMELAGAESDGLILQLASPSVVEWSVGHARKGRAAAGKAMGGIRGARRGPDRISPRTASTPCRAFAAFRPRCRITSRDLLRHYAPSDLPADLVEGMDRVGGYDYQQHGQPDAPHVRAVTDAMAERLTLVGTAAQVRDKIKKLEAAGVTQVCLYLSIVEPDRHFSTLETYGREIIPAFR